jgi:hypothetical protein
VVDRKEGRRREYREKRRGKEGERELYNGQMRDQKGMQQKEGKEIKL